jgi:hypothetical protein
MAKGLGVRVTGSNLWEMAAESLNGKDMIAMVRESTIGVYGSNQSWIRRLVGEVFEVGILGKWRKREVE